VPEEEVTAEVALRRRVQEEVERLSAEQPQVLATLLKTWLSAE
jgi:flagellar biosynthesis/type III secretory pathway M-ring protein FliF/YscJ